MIIVVDATTGIAYAPGVLRFADIIALGDGVYQIGGEVS